MGGTELTTNILSEKSGFPAFSPKVKRGSNTCTEEVKSGRKRGGKGRKSYGIGIHSSYDQYFASKWQKNRGSAVTSPTVKVQISLLKRRKMNGKKLEKGGKDRKKMVQLKP